MPYDFDKNTTPDAHLFAATAGTNTARDYMARALRDPDFPDDFQERGTEIHRRIVELDKDLAAHAESIRRRTRQASPDTGYVKDANWAMLGVSNAIRELQAAVRKGGREYGRALNDAKGILSDMEPLVDELREYAAGYHPLEWASRAIGDLAERIPQAFAQWTYAPGPVRRPTLVAAGRGKSKKDVGHGGLDEWFSGHGGDEGEATWGDWVAISPVKKKVERELADGTVKEKTVQPGDIVGPCGVSDDPEWKGVTRGGKDPLKCMPRQKAHDMPRRERAELAREKMRAERDDGNRGKKPTHTRTFEKEASDPVVAGDNEPTKPDLWEEAKGEAKDRYTKWPSAYAVGHALALYKERGGGWRKKSASLSDRWDAVIPREWPH
jgi:hypothetical protein